MDELEARMREKLLQLALISNGRTQSFAASGGGEPDHTPRLGPEDAPHLHFKARWDAATTDAERQKVYDDAAARLRHEQRSSGDRTRVESKAERDARIVDVGEGVAAKDLAIRFRCGVTDVRKAREAAGRETEYGKRPRNGRELSPDQRRAEVHRLVDEEGMSSRQVAVALELSYSTVLRLRGQKD